MILNQIICCTVVVIDSSLPINLVNYFRESWQTDLQIDFSFKLVYLQNTMPKYKKYPIDYEIRMVCFGIFFKHYLMSFIKLKSKTFKLLLIVESHIGNKVP